MIAKNPGSNKSARWREAVVNFVTGPDGTSGAALVELSVFMPILCVLIIGLADFGMFIYRMSQLQYAAQAGAQWAIQNGTYNAASIQAAAQSAVSFTVNANNSGTAEFCGCPTTTGITTISCTSNCSDGSTPVNYVSVQAQATYNTLLPSALSPYPLLISYSNALSCPGDTTKICATATVRIP